MPGGLIDFIAEASLELNWTCSKPPVAASQVLRLWLRDHSEQWHIQEESAKLDLFRYMCYKWKRENIALAIDINKRGFLVSTALGIIILSTNLSVTF